MTFHQFKFFGEPKQLIAIGLDAIVTYYADHDTTGSWIHTADGGRFLVTAKFSEINDLFLRRSNDGK